MTQPPPPTVLAGLIGRAIGLSRTPAMHEREGAALGIRYVYRLLDVDLMDPAPPLEELLRAAEICGFAGLNITFPYKIEVMRHLHELSASAEKAGAVNTVVLGDGRRIGHNTDMWGFAEGFRRHIADADRDRVLLIGAGGAGNAVAHALLDNAVGHLGVHDTDAARAAQLVDRLTRRYGRDRAAAVADPAAGAGRLDGVVNATPVGMAKLPGCPFPPHLLRPDLWVADIIYFPIETELLRAARARGCRTLDGSAMAVFQAVRAFELFGGAQPDYRRMRETFESFDRPEDGRTS